MSVTDQLLENNEKYAAGFTGPLPCLPPRASPSSRAWTPGWTSTACSASRRATRT